MITVVDKFIDWAHSQLKENDDAQAYLWGRGISEFQWDRHRLGYVDGQFDCDPSTDFRHNESCENRDLKAQWCDTCRYRSWSSLWEDNGSGWKDRKIGARISGGVVFPLTSYSGANVGFQVRSISQKVFDTFTLKERPEGYFFGINKAISKIWETKEIWLTEGPGDALLVERFAVENVVALTTSSLSKHQMRFLDRFVSTVYLCLDMDKAGREGAAYFKRHNAEKFEIHDVKYAYPGLTLDDNKDVGNIWKKIGDEKFGLHMKRILDRK